MPFSNAARLSDREIAREYTLSWTYSDISGPLRSLHVNSHIEIVESKELHIKHTITSPLGRIIASFPVLPASSTLISGSPKPWRKVCLASDVGIHVAFQLQGPGCKCVLSSVGTRHRSQSEMILCRDPLCNVHSPSHVLAIVVQSQ